MSQLVGLVVYAPKGRRKRDDEDVPIKKIGKVRNVVCSPSGKRVVGLIVHQRDIAGMIAQPDLFVAYDAFEPYDKGIVISRPDDGVDNAARARLGLDWDSCIIWNGMDAKTEDDRQLGYVADIEFSAKTGKVRYFHLGDGNMSESLVGHVAVPGSMLIGYQDGWMIVDPEAAHLELSGGAAAKAGEGYARAKEGVSKATKKAGKVVGDAVDKGSRKVGKALGKAKRAVGKDYIAESFYDDAGRQLRHVRTDREGNFINVFVYTYHENGQKATERTEDYTINHKWYETVYDEAGNVISQESGSLE